jgi:hypothetical protein
MRLRPGASAPATRAPRIQTPSAPAELASPAQNPRPASGALDEGHDSRAVLDPQERAVDAALCAGEGARVDDESGPAIAEAEEDRRVDVVVTRGEVVAWASSPVKCATMAPAGDSIATPTRWPTSSSNAASVSSNVMPHASWRACRSARARLGAQSALGPTMDASRCPRRRMKRQKSLLGSTVDRLHARRSRRADQIAGG